MNKLMVKWRDLAKNKPFHPRITLRDTGYSKSHWQLRLFREDVMMGGPTLKEMDLQEVIAHYFSELKRCHHKEAAPNAKP